MNVWITTVTATGHFIAVHSTLEAALDATERSSSTRPLRLTYTHGVVTCGEWSISMASISAPAR